MLVESVKDAAGWLNYLAIARFAKLGRITAALWMICQLLDMRKDPHNKCSRSDGIFQSDVVSDCVKICQGWLCPDYFSHLASRVLA